MLRKHNKYLIITVVFTMLVTMLIIISNIDDNKLEGKISIDGDYFAILLDDQKLSSLPDAGSYLVDYTCDNGSKIEWNKETGKITLSKNSALTESCSLVFKTNPFVSELPQGSYIAYEGNNGCLRDGSATATVSSNAFEAKYENSNSCLGYNANANADGTKDSVDGMYGYCYNTKERYHVSGWRLAYTKDGSAYIISAGAVECNSNIASTGNKTYITKANLSAKKYCNSKFVDDCSKDSFVHAINNNDFNMITSQFSNTSGGYIYTEIPNAVKCTTYRTAEVCGYNNDLIDIGSSYWVAEVYMSTSNLGVFWTGSSRSMAVLSNNNTNSYGLRPVIGLSSDIIVTGGNGTMDDPYKISNSSFNINNNAKVTSTPTVSLSFKGDGISEMCISNTPNCTEYEPFSAEKEWALTSGDGEKKVYVYYKDSNGNIVASLFRTIILGPNFLFAVSEDFSDTTYDSNLTIAGSGDYPWTVDTDNLYFRSNNKGSNSTSSTSTIVFTPTNASKLSFDWGVSSESNYDKLTIKLTGSDSTSVTLVDAQSGTKTGSITDQALSSNVTYTLTLTYTKDSSSASGSDIGYIDNLHIGT